MNTEKLLSLILDTGAAMIRSGAETHRTEDSLYRLCAAYGLTDCNIWVVPSNIQATVTDPAGSIITQVRHVRGTDTDFDRLHRLNSLCRKACAEKPGEDEFGRLLAEAQNTKRSPIIPYLAGLLAGVGFGVFFNCGIADAAVAALTSILITLMWRALSRRESNPLIVNFLISFVAELFILLCVHLGFGQHTGYISVGVAMLLISALSTTNGVRDLVHLDTISGVTNITLSLTGAVGIALGIALPLLILPGWGTGEGPALCGSVAIGLASATVGCIGFALWFGVADIRHIAICAAGALITWGVYLIAARFIEGAFFPTLIGALVCSAYAEIAARLIKAPATIFRTISVFPLIPGSTLYHTMYGVVTSDSALASQKGLELVLVCFGIVLGFMAVEAAVKFFRKRA